MNKGAGGQFIHLCWSQAAEACAFSTPHGFWQFGERLVAEKTTYSLTTGTTSTSKRGTTSQTGSKFTAAVSAGITAGPVSASVSVSKEMSQSIAKKFSTAISQTTSSTVSQTFDASLQGNYIFQWTMSAAQPDCNGAGKPSEYIVKTQTIAVSPSKVESPCCLPGYFWSEDLLSQTCVNKEGTISKGNNCCICNSIGCDNCAKKVHDNSAQYLGTIEKHYDTSIPKTNLRGVLPSFAHEPAQAEESLVNVEAEE